MFYMVHARQPGVVADKPSRHGEVTRSHVFHILLVDTYRACDDNGKDLAEFLDVTHLTLMAWMRGDSEPHANDLEERIDEVAVYRAIELMDH